MATLTFSDDFNSLSVWNAQYNPNGVWRDNYGYGGINDYTLPGEQELYTGPYFNGHPGDFNDGNYQVSNGVLSLVAHQTTNPEVLAMGYDFTSGMITTRGLAPWLTGGPTAQFSQEYGFFEMRAKIATDPGAWNAFWMLPAGGTSSGWNPGEVDIMESVGKEHGAVWQATHGATESGSYASGVNVDDGQFHTFALDWTATTLTWYVDGVATRTEATPADMHQPYAIFADLALGGSWAGPIDLSPTGGSDALQIDYIKAWDSNPYVSGSDASVAAPAAAETLSAPDAGASLTGGGGDDLVQGGAGADVLSGGDGQDTMHGGDGPDSLNGNVGNDMVHGDAGSDVVLGGKNDDTLFGDLGDDTMNGNLSADTVDGGDGNDVVRGGQGDDVLTGGTGDDWLSGDRGDDTITGGTGADTFFSFGDAGIDLVTDFHAAEGDHVLIAAGATYSVAQSGADVVIDITGGAQLILQGVDLASLPPGWILSA